jgi:hypothetical protein
MASRALTIFTLGLLHLSKAAQPTRKGKPGAFEIVGDSGVSAQQLFLGANNKACYFAITLIARYLTTT